MPLLRAFALWVVLTAPWAASAEPFRMPERPLKDQMLAPCPPWLVEVVGGCWDVVDAKAPCPDMTVQHEKRCFKPVRAPAPRSLPAKPYDWQAKPPCEPSEDLINGGCWALLPKVRPPCPGVAVSFEGQCWRPAQPPVTFAYPYDPDEKYPFPEQVRPPCDRYLVELDGGCWMEVASPCTPTARAYKGLCLMPLGQPRARPLKF